MENLIFNWQGIYLCEHRNSASSRRLIPRNWRIKFIVMKKNFVLIILLVASFTVNGQNFDSTVEKLIEENIDEIIELRHWFHQNAELSNREFKTAERIKNELIKLVINPILELLKQELWQSLMREKKVLW